MTCEKCWTRMKETTAPWQHASRLWTCGTCGHRVCTMQDGAIVIDVPRDPPTATGAAWGKR